MSEWKDLRRRIGRNIHAIRTRKQITLEKLSRLSGFSADTIDRLELGKDEVNVWHLMKLAEVLGVEEAALLAR